MYSSEINRKQPACLLFLVDQSLSMAESWAETNTSKAGQLALAVNRMLANAVLQCSKGDGRVYDYFEVGVFGYGSDVQAILHGTNESRPVLPVSELGDNPLRVDEIARKIPDGAGGIVETTINVPIWVEPSSNGKTPMVAALQTAERLVSTWCQQHPNSFPPIIINLTDGASSDGDPTPTAEQIRDAETQDGAALLFNVHLSAIKGEQVAFASSPATLPNDHASTLFRMSSVLPSCMTEAASAKGFSVDPSSRGFLYNADATDVIEFLDIGTRAATPTGLAEITDGDTTE